MLRKYHSAITPALREERMVRVFALIFMLSKTYVLVRMIKDNDPRRVPHHR